MKPWERFKTFKQRGEWVELRFMAEAALRGYHELPRIPFVGASITLSSRAQQDRVRSSDPAQSRDPVPASSQQRPGKESSAQTSAGAAFGKNSSLGRQKWQANAGSFDSANRLASESVRYDNAGKMEMNTER